MSVNLRCASCGHSLKMRESRPVRLFGVFRCEGAPEIPGPDRPSFRRRCRSCGFVNIFEVIEVDIVSPCR